jgi:hypothetical protein
MRFTPPTGFEQNVEGGTDGVRRFKDEIAGQGARPTEEQRIKFA